MIKGIKKWKIKGSSSKSGKGCLSNTKHSFQYPPEGYKNTEVFFMQYLCAFVFRKRVRYNLKANLFSLYAHFSGHSATKIMQFPQISEEPNKRLAIAGKHGKE
ncbi:MAG: hypothetical protein KKD73_07270 [Proteobacteria bacterium]|nr:hypothetical protein [Pseudomonadota bacterium]MBU1638955.1 hypothetical protein [Pseudomonadota bacterium]